MHYRMRGQHKKEMQEVAYYMALQNKKKFDKARLIFTAYYKGNRKHDPDNLYVKPFLDGLVQAGMIKDDSNLYVQSVTLKVETGAKSDYVTIEIL